MSNRELIEEASLYANDDGIMGMPQSPNAKFCDLICRLAAALEAQEWQPIEMAPIDRVIDLWSPYTHTYVHKFHNPSTSFPQSL
jgi:hypothetical protein